MKSTSTSPISSFKHEAIAILGIPIDNLSLEEIVKEILLLIENYKKPDYVGTINVDFLMNTLGWNPDTLSHAELHQALLGNILNAADGMPIIWLSTFLNCKIKERVAGADFLPKLIELCSKKGKSVFLLGSDAQTAQKAAEKLQTLFPSLNLAGTASPHVFVSGIELEDAYEKDIAIIEQINHCSPDLLLIFFGNPKQEIWFQRIRHLLRVPVTIGGGGTLSFISGYVPRAPVWVQKIGLEWFYRLMTEPSRLWKRYLYDLVKLLYISFPLIMYHCYNKLVSSFFSSQSSHLVKLDFSSSQQSLSVIILPTHFNKKASWDVRDLFEESLKRDFLVIDFRLVRYIDASAIGFLLRLWKFVSESHRKIFILGISRQVKRSMKLHRSWSQIHSHYFENIEDLIALLNTQIDSTIFFTTIENKESYSIVYFFGQIDATQDHRVQFTRFSQSLNNQHIILNFQYCTFVDSSGMGLLLKLRHFCVDNKKELVLCELSSNLKQMFHISKLDTLFNFYQHLPEAELYIINPSKNIKA